MTHPFHPLRGRRFLVLKVRRVGGREVLSLFDELSGSITLPREWTDQSPPSMLSAVLSSESLILHPACLLQLQELAQVLKEKD